MTITVPTPAGTTFRSVSGTLPLAVGGAPGGPARATPAPGGTGPIVCTGALGATSPDDETLILVRLLVDPGAAVGSTIDVEASATLAGDPDTTDNDDSSSRVIVAGRSIVSAGPTDEIMVTDDLACQAHHAGDTWNSFYGFTPGDCLTVLLVESTDTLYGAEGWFDEDFTPVSQTLAGTGTAADPFTIVTVVDAGTSGLRLVQTDSYVVGQPQWRTDVEVVNTTGAPQDVRLYRAADCYLGGSDSGFGQLGPQAGAVACRSELGRLLQWVPITPGSNYYEGFYGDVWDFVSDKLPFPDTCECAIDQDNGAGLSWDLTVGANTSATVSHTTAILVTSVSKTADQPRTFVGQPNGYSITVTNYDSTPVTLTTIADALPGGFAYTPGSTTGATTADPSVAAGTLTWTGPFTVPAGTAEAPGTLVLHFGVTVSTTPGNYTNEASATTAGDTVEVTPSGPTAPVTVLANAPQTIVFGPAPVSPGRRQLHPLGYRRRLRQPGGLHHRLRPVLHRRRRGQLHGRGHLRGQRQPGRRCRFRPRPPAAADVHHRQGAAGHRLHLDAGGPDGGRQLHRDRHGRRLGQPGQLRLGHAGRLHPERRHGQLRGRRHLHDQRQPGRQRQLRGGPPGAADLHRGQGVAEHLHRGLARQSGRGAGA